MAFPILYIEEHVGDTEERIARRLEPMGTKEKFWYEDSTYGKCLFKKARLGTGEDWAEKLAAYFCDCLQIPHASYELAIWRDSRGTLSPCMHQEHEWLISGNELLSEYLLSYEATTKKRGDNKHHTLQNIFSVLEQHHVQAPKSSYVTILEKASEFFIGYLLLDALIGNQDRHHEN
jgi:hypothetical protein